VAIQYLCYHRYWIASCLTAFAKTAFVVAKRSLALLPTAFTGNKNNRHSSPNLVMARPSGLWPSSTFATIATGLLHAAGIRKDGVFVVARAPQADLSIQIPILCFRRSRKLIRIA